MLLTFCSRSIRLAFGATLILVCFTSISTAQTEDALGDNPDPVRLFERAQAAHARREFERALELYEEAIKVRPEFPEAEFQRGNTLVSLKRLADAEPAFRRAIELRKNWSLPYTALGVLLVRSNREAEAAPILEQALKLDKNDSVALRVLATLRLQSGNSREALRLAQIGTTGDDVPAAAWIVRARQNELSETRLPPKRVWLGRFNSNRRTCPHWWRMRISLFSRRTTGLRSRTSRPRIESVKTTNKFCRDW